MCRIVLLAIVVVVASTSALLSDEPTRQPLRPPKDVQTSRLRELKALSDHNIQMLMIALSDYNTARGHYPPAVVVGPDGKTPHSWRVEILPFIQGEFSETLGQPGHPYKKLYNQYRLNEAWDGPHNKRLLKQMPDIFRAPTDAADATETVYFAVAGKGAIFDGPKGTPVADINDGSLRTILLVESKPSAPWTRPVDLAYGPEKPLPTLGGVYAGGFIAVDAGGRRHFVPSNIRDAHLRALITRNGKDDQYDFPAEWALRVR